jgi:hypothetical protein
MRRLLLGIALSFVLFVASTPASAHAAGSPPITQSGSITLTAGGPNSTFHANITNLGIPPGPGDTLRFSWSANAGRGPAVHFEIHSHSSAGGYKEYYSVPLAARDAGNWTVPGPDVYMVLWQNPSTTAVNVTYNFQLMPPPLDLTVFAVFPVILGVVVLLLWVAHRRPRPPKPEG